MTKISARNTKTEILSAYKDLQKSHRDLKKQFTLVQNAPAPQAPTAGPSTRETPKLTVIDATSPLGVAEELESAAQRANGAAAQLQRSLTEKTRALQALRGELASGEARLQQLHEITFESDTLDILLQRYVEAREAGASELQDARVQGEEALADARNDWDEARSAHEAARKAQLKARDIEYKRRIEAEDYALEQTIVREEDTIEQEGVAFAAELAQMREDAEADWARVEDELSRREQELGDLRTKAEALPGERSREVKKAEDAGRSIALRQAQGQIELRAKEEEGRKRVHESTVATLTKTLNEHEERVAALSEQLAAALHQTQDLAVKAIDGASNAQSFHAIREIAIEQAKFPAKVK